MREPRDFFDSPRFDNARANQKTMHDLNEAGGRLVALCKKCLHLAELPPDQLIEILGWDFTLFAMRKVLRCVKCKTRGLANVHEVWPTKELRQRRGLWRYLGSRSAQEGEAWCEAGLQIRQ